MKDHPVLTYIRKLFAHTRNVYSATSFILSVLTLVIPKGLVFADEYKNLLAVTLFAFSLLAASYHAWKENWRESLKLEIESSSIELHSDWWEFEPTRGYSVQPTVNVTFLAMIYVINNSPSKIGVTIDIEDIKSNWIVSAKSSLNEINSRANKSLQGSRAEREVQVIKNKFYIPGEYNTLIQIKAVIPFDIPKDTDGSRYLRKLRQLDVFLKLQPESGNAIIQKISFDDKSIIERLQASVVSGLRHNEDVKRNHFEGQLLFILEQYTKG